MGRETHTNQGWFYKNEEIKIPLVLFVMKPFVIERSFSVTTAWERAAKRFAGFLLLFFGFWQRSKLKGLKKNLEKGILLACARKAEQHKPSAGYSGLPCLGGGATTPDSTPDPAVHVSCSEEGC